MSKFFTKELVDDLANKLLIGLSEEENAMVLNEFDAIDANIDLIKSLFFPNSLFLPIAAIIDIIAIIHLLKIKQLF